MGVPLIADLNRPDAPPRMPDWREIFSIVLERAWIGLAVMALVFAGSYINLKRTVPSYRSTAVLLVEPQIPRLLNYPDVLSVNIRNLEYFNTVINTLHSRQMMEYAVQQSGLAGHPDFFPGLTGSAAKASAARGLVSITPVERSRLVNITAEHSNPEVASELANAMARAYIQQDLDNRMNTSLQAVEWLRVRSQEYREQLEKGLLELQEYREKAGSVSLEEDQNIVIEKLKALNSALTRAQTDRIDAEAGWRAVQSMVENGVPWDQVALQLSQEGLGEILSAWRAQQQRTVLLRQRYKSGYPELQDAEEVERVLRFQFEEAARRAVQSVQNQYETSKKREEGLRAALAGQEQLAFALARQLVQYNDLRRNVEADQEIYQAMISRMKEASITETLPSDVIRLAEEARPASRPFKPQPARVLMRGALLGLALGIGAIFLLYFGDHRFRRSEEVERALGVPVLTSIPLITGKTVHERGMICHLKQTCQTTEAFRTLRTMTQTSPDIRAAKVFLITSTQPGEGKSLVAANLAISFAKDGRKTLLIGADLRRPAFEDIFEFQTGRLGLSDVLKGKLPLQEAVLADRIPGLDVLCSGGHTAHAAELLGTPALAALMEEARGRYDRIVIDSTPMMSVSDTLLLIRHADGILFVVRQGVTHSLGAGHAIKRIHKGGSVCFGVIMNGVNLNALAHYYYYRRYGVYAGYEYRDQEEEASGA